MTMELKLPTGKSVYYSQSALVWKLLQNAIDAILLRAEMNSVFDIEKTRI